MKLLWLSAIILWTVSNCSTGSDLLNAFNAVYEGMKGEMLRPRSNKVFASHYHRPSEDAKLEQKRGEMLNRITKYMMEKYGYTLDEMKKMDAAPIMSKLNVTMRVEPTADGPIQCLPTSCDPKIVDRFRSISGICNNRARIMEGSAMTEMRRLLPAKYDDDIGQLRTRSKNGGLLPSTRVVSNKVFRQADDKDPDTKYNHFLQQFGQFVAHDYAQLPSSVAANGDDLDCSICDPRKRDVNCAGIDVPNGDPYFYNQRCIRFARAANGQKGLGERTQLNGPTQYIDLSLVYGNDECQSRKLRSSGGRMKHAILQQKRMLPTDPMNSACESRYEKMDCFLAGDNRNSLHPGLPPMHFMFMEYHNLIAEKFLASGVNWDDDRIFHEARRINIAIFQNMIYSQYLPKIIGPTMMQRFDLNVRPPGGFYNGYNRDSNGQISAEFAGAAFRFGHSTTRREFPRVTYKNTTVGSSLNIGDFTFYVEPFYDKQTNMHESVTHGMMLYPQMKLDNEFSQDIRNRVLEIRGHQGSGIDLTAVNMQRARDLGISGYNAYRTTVGLKKANTFDDLSREFTPDRLQLIKNTYADVDDIDLYVGIVSETPLPDGQLGPTASFIIADQFSASKKSDRFYFENTGVFTSAQLAAIRMFDPRHIFCANSGSTVALPKDVFLYNSPLEPCSSIRPFNIDPFLMN